MTGQGGAEERGHRERRFPRLRRLHAALHAHPALALTTKAVVALVGTAVTLVGVVMIVTPGPAFVLIPLGLGILATEFEFAQRWLASAREQARRARERAARTDPKVRRRRRLVGTLLMLGVLAAVAVYVVLFDWPVFAVGGWDKVQSLAGWVPDLPGM